MRRRLLVVIVILTAAFVAAAGIPLAVALAGQQSQQVYDSRTQDLRYFADVAETALSAGASARLELDLQRYEELYGAPIFVVTDEREVFADSGPGAPGNDDAVRSAVLHALTGRSLVPRRVAWPWEDRPVMFAEPVVRDGQVLGAAVSIVDTTELREDVTRTLATVAAGGLLALTAMVLVVALPVARWVLRPVRTLDAATRRVIAGQLGDRVPEQHGPPELRRLAADFNTMADHVAASLERQRAFVANASHQLRNPLTALRLRVEGLAHSLAASDDRREAELALLESQRLSEIVDGLLVLARAEATATEPEPVDLAEVVRHRVDVWRPAYADASTPLTLDAPASLPVRVLPDVVDAALDALLDNARTYAPGRPVDLQLRTVGDMVEIVVRDRGSGLDAEERERAGERFWRGSRHAGLPGTGLGLAITRALVDAAGGDLRLEQTDPQGLTVRLRLPQS